MKRAVFALLFAALLAPVAVLASPKALPPPGQAPDSFGVNIHFTGAPARDLDAMQQAGFRWARMDFVWDAVEKTKGVYNFAAYDSLLAGLAAHKMKPLFILDYGNDLYQQGSPRTPEARAAFAQFAAASASHYRGKPILWEIWNEPNGDFWKPSANAEEYAQLALVTARAIRVADPGATILAPGTSGLPLPFMETAFRDGLLKYIDAVSFHPYRGSNPETAAGDYADVRRLVAKYAPGRDVPLVSSEWGYTTVSVSEQTQAQYLTRQWLSNLAEGIRVSIWYDWHEDGTDPKNGEHHFGTVRYDYAPKPAYIAAKTLTHALAGYTFVKRLSLPSGKDYLLLLRRGQSVKLVAWTTGAAHPITLPLARRTRALNLVDASARTLSGPLMVDGSPQCLDPAPQAAVALRHAADWTVQAQNAVYGKGQAPRVGLMYSNRDAAAHKVGFVVSFRTPDGSVPQTVRAPERRTPPGQSLPVQTVTAPFSRVPVRARVALVLDGRPQPYSQDVSFTPSDPIDLSVAPQGKSGFVVQIANPAGTAFRGRLTSQPASATLPVRLAAGQRAASIAAPGDPDRLTAWTLRDEAGRAVSTLPPGRFQAVPIDWAALKTHLDGDLKVPSEIHAALVPTGGLQVSYTFAPGWTFWQSDLPNAPALDGKPVALGLWVQGDGSGSLVRMRFRDAGGQTFQPGGTLMDWTGWRWVTFPLRTDSGQDMGHWGGANDGVIHGPVSIGSLFLLDSPTDAKQRYGVVSFRQPALLYGR